MAETITRTKRALVVGCNYPGTLAELHGCVNDAWQVHDLLVSVYGFDVDHMEVLVDDHVDGRDAPTGANIRRSLARMASSSQPGDLLFFHFSGHGTRLPPHDLHDQYDDEDSVDHGGVHDDRDGDYDECIVPSDMNLLTDEDFREIANVLPSGVAFTIVADSCHSGGLVQYEKEQIGDSFFHGLNPNGKREAHSSSLKYTLPALLEEEEETSATEFTSQEKEQDYNGYEGKKRYLPLSTLLEILKQKSGDDVKLGKIRTTLYSLFMDVASLKVKRLHNILTQKIRQHEVQERNNKVKEDQLQLIQRPKHHVIDNVEIKDPASHKSCCKINLAEESKKRGSFFSRSTTDKDKSDMAILLSACQAYESSRCPPTRWKSQRSFWSNDPCVMLHSNSPTQRQ